MSQQPGRAWSGFGVASAALAVVCAVTVVMLGLIWSGHRAADRDRAYQARVLQAAAQWTGVLINMNPSNVEASMARLRDGTVGELNSGFESSIAPYRDVVKTLRSTSTGQVDSVSIEAVHHDLDTAPGQRPPSPPALPADLAARTDTVLVVATSVSDNAGSQGSGPAATPTIVRWNLRLGVSEVDGAPMISRLESLR